MEDEGDSRPFQVAMTRKNKRKTVRRELSDTDSDERVKKCCDRRQTEPVLQSSIQAQQENLTRRMQQDPIQQEARINGRKRLLFPSTCPLTFHQKLEWTVQLAKEFGEYEPLFKEGVHRPYITVGTDEAVEHLTTDGFRNIVLVIPEVGIIYTKVIVFKYPTYLDPEFLQLNNDSVVWVKRNVIRGEKQSQVVALLKGEAPERIFVQGLGYRKVSKYIEEPTLCMKCSRWGHMAWKCQFDPRCRYCGKKHDSRQCRVMIDKGEKILPSCCNCRGIHNAGSSLCPMKPRVRDSKPVTISRVNEAPKEGKIVHQEQGGNSGKTTIASVTNVWEKGTATIRDSLVAVRNEAEKVFPSGDEVQGSVVDSAVGTQILEYLKKLDKRIEALEKLAMANRGSEVGSKVGSVVGSVVRSEVGNETEGEESKEEDGVSQMEESQENELSTNDGSVQPRVVENVDGEAQEKWNTQIELEDIVQNRVTCEGSRGCTSAEQEKISKCWETLTKQILVLRDLKCGEGVDKLMSIINELANRSKVQSLGT